MRRAKSLEALSWLHTCLGLSLGAVLFAIFWMGTLSVFDREIDRWMMPSTRVSAPVQPFSADAVFRRNRAKAIGSPLWVLTLPSDREPVARLQFAPVGSRERAAKIERSHKGIPLPRERLAIFLVDPATGAILPDPGTLGATGFFFPLHWHLMLGEGSIGQWIVGAAGLAMLVSIISGVMIHRKIFVQFFTLRTSKRGGRMLLDLHNAAGVMAMPFHAMITFSGLAIFYFFYFPAPLNLTHQGGERQLFIESRSGYSRPRAGRPADMASLDRMIGDAKELWGSGQAARVTITFPGDANAYVQVTRTVNDLVPNNPQPIYFDAATGSLIKFSGIRPVATAQRYIAGLHFIAFNDWVLRWLYFMFGLIGCGMIATGALFWSRKRRKSHGPSAGAALVKSLTVASTTGLIGATGFYLVANRLLPADLPGRANTEIGAFAVAWLALAIHAGVRRGSAWSDQWGLIAATSIGAVLLNALTTGDHLVRTISRWDWAVAGTDIVLLAWGVVGLFLWHRLRKSRPSSQPLAVEVPAQ